MNFETSLDAITWFALPCTPIAGGTAVTTVTSPGLFIVSVAGLSLVRARLSGTVTGQVTVLGFGTVASL